MSLFDDPPSFDTTPSAGRNRSYNGGYMDAGRAAEETVLPWLRTRPWVVGVEDFRSLRALQEADCDCGITLVDGRITIAEIKSDRHLGRSGNFLFEILRIDHTAPSDRAVTLGWSARTPARQILYYAPTSKTLHGIAADEFRRALQGYTEACRGDTRISYVRPTASKARSTF